MTKWDFRLRSDGEGCYRLRTVLPVPYEIGRNDGPVGMLLRRLGRQRTRPAHLHFKVSADGYRPLTTMVFFEGGRHLDSDPVMAVTDSLIVALVRDERTEELGAPSSDRARWSARFDFSLPTV